MELFEKLKKVPKFFLSFTLVIVLFIPPNPLCPWPFIKIPITWKPKDKINIERVDWNKYVFKLRPPTRRSFCYRNSVWSF